MQHSSIEAEWKEIKKDAHAPTCPNACTMDGMSSCATRSFASIFCMLANEMLASFGDLMPHAARNGFKMSCNNDRSLTHARKEFQAAAYIIIERHLDFAQNASNLSVSCQHFRILLISQSP